MDRERERGKEEVWEVERQGGQEAGRKGWRDVLKFTVTSPSSTDSSKSRGRKFKHLNVTWVHNKANVPTLKQIIQNAVKKSLIQPVNVAKTYPLFSPDGTK
ncbi:hypothetical protein CHS0354_040968, partial [Potamilus streckersoni]